MKALGRGIAFIVVWTMSLYVASHGHDWNRLVSFSVIFMTYVIYYSCLQVGAKE